MITDNLMNELKKLEGEFKNRNRLNVYNAIVISIANVFREERDDIFKAHNISTIGAGATRATRYVPTPKVPINPNPTAKQRKYDKPCATCGKNKQQQLPLDPETQVQVQGHVTAEQVLQAKSWREIMNVFSGREEDMQKFAKSFGINLGNSKKVETISKRIYQFMQDEYKA